MKSDAYYITELENKILEVVYNNTKDIPRPFGLLLSGGFDSGLLAALTKPDYIFTVKLPYGPLYDESRYADAIVKHLGLENYNLIMTKELFEKNFKDAVLAMGEPISHFSLVPFYTLMKEIKTVFPICTTVLSGEGPDEYLGGYARQIIFDELHKLYEIPELYNYHGMIDKVIGNSDLIWRYGEMMNYDATEVANYVTTEYPLQGCIGKMDMELGVIEKMEQRLAEINGINLEYPYINNTFAEYCYHLPDHLKIRNGVTKWLFRQVCKKYLPEFMWNRSKVGGPVFPVNKVMGWMIYGEFNKNIYLQKQKEILDKKI